MATDAETFTVLPLTINPTTKAISALPDNNSFPNLTPGLEQELARLNGLHRTMLNIDTPSHIPPPPIPVNPKRSAQISKLRDSGNDAYRKAKHADALKFYSLGLQMALARPPWEPAGLVRDEVAGLYANRAQAHMAMQSWAEGAIDAQCSVEAKRPGNAKAWWRRGKCLLEMGRLDEALEWIGKGLEVEGEESELEALKGEIETRLEKTRK